jgi:tetratricopeptide (TPR) repeat protein
MFMRTAGAVCLLLLAVQEGWSQYRPGDQQLHFWTDLSFTTGQVPDAIEAQQLRAGQSSEVQNQIGDRISVEQLRHKVPGKAMSSFSQGLKFAQAGDFLRAARDFEHAATIDPEFAAAHGDLGVMYLDLSLVDQAVTEFRRALELDPRDSFLHGNLALALIILDRPAQAEPEAQAAVALDSSNAKARYLYGLLLARRPEARPKAAEQLIYASQKLPEAHLALATLYQQEGSDALAQTEQERYRKAILMAVKQP